MKCGIYIYIVSVGGPGPCCSNPYALLFGLLHLPLQFLTVGRWVSSAVSSRARVRDETGAIAGARARTAARATLRVGLGRGRGLGLGLEGVYHWDTATARVIGRHS